MPFASAQTPANIAVVMGNGQLVCSAGCTAAPPPTFPGALYAIVTDANNNPIPSYPTTWTVVTGPAILGGGSTLSTNTGADGSTTVSPFLNIGFVPGGSPTLPSTITVSAGNITQTFTLTNAVPCTTVFCGAGNGLSVDQMFIDFSQVPLGGISGSAGGAGAPFTVRIQALNGGGPVPGVSVRLINDDGSSGPSPNQPSAYCQTGAGADPYSVLSDSTGTATCTPRFGPVGGSTHQVIVLVGGIPAGIWSDGTSIPGYAAGTLFNPTGIVYSPNTIPPLAQGYRLTGNINLSVKAASIGSLTVTSGNNQSASPGSALPSPLVATMKDTSGNPLAGQGVIWSVAPTTAATLTNQTTVTSSTGQVTTGVTLSSTASGNVTIRATSASDGSKVASFTATVIPPVTLSSLTKVSGDAQSTVVGQAFGTPLAVQVAVNGGSVANITVAFAVSGPATLSAASAVTNANGVAQVTATAGSTTGNVIVTASAGGLSQIFNLVVNAPVVFSASNFVNGADQQKGSISPCGLVTIAASGIAPAVAGSVSAPLVGPLPLSLSGVTVAFNSNDYAPVVSVSANAVTFLLPCDVTPASAVPVTVSASGSTGTVNVPVLAASPGIFSTVQSDGVSRAVIVRPDGSFVSPQNPARRGEFVTALVTGLGPVSPSVATNALPIPGTPSTVTGQMIVGVNNEGTVVQSAQLSPDRQGVYSITFQIPQDAPQANNVVFSVGVIPPGATAPAYSAGSQIPVQ